jgi:Ser/Thr protein kinase RdoA (MazF antagonist)
MDELIQEHFAIIPVEIKKLNGYDNANFLITTEHKKYILKAYHPDFETMELLKAENLILLTLQKKSKDIYPSPIPFTDGSYLKIIETDSKKYIWQLLSFLDGEFLGEVIHNKEMFRSLGKFLAETDLRLKTLHHPIIETRRWKWDIQYLYLSEKYIEDIPHISNRQVVRRFFRLFDEHIVPLLPVLRKQIIHNDANEWNVLTKNNRVSGMIDFNDLSYTCLVNEPAIALTYACFDKKDPLEWAIPIIKAYHRVLPLEAIELKVLYYLVAARLSQSVCNAAYARKIIPENEHAFVSEEKAWRMLHIWADIDPADAEKIITEAVK